MCAMVFLRVAACWAFFQLSLPVFVCLVVATSLPPGCTVLSGELAESGTSVVTLSHYRSLTPSRSGSCPLGSRTVLLPWNLLAIRSPRKVFRQPSPAPLPHGPAGSP